MQLSHSKSFSFTGQDRELTDLNSLVQSNITNLVIEDEDLQTQITGIYLAF